MSQTVLVTGGNGSLGSHIVSQLLQQDFQVRTSVRNEKSQAGLLKILTENKIPTEKLEFVFADLMKDDHWLDAMQGVDVLLSVASPVFFSNESEEEMLNVSKTGTLRLLKFAEQAGVKRVVMTANYGAIGFSSFDKSHTITEDDWTDPEQKGLSLYEKSKLIAEKAAWDFVKSENQPFEFVTINPVAMLGPSLDGHFSGSFSILTPIIKGEMKQIPNIPMNIVDVRDVARMHVLAVTEPKAAGQRFIASADGQISMPEFAELFKAKRPELSGKITSKRMADWIIKLGAPFNKQAREGKLLLTLNRKLSIQKAKDLLGWTPEFDNEAVLLASIDSMKKYEQI